MIETIKNLALSLGVSDIGFAPCKPLEDYEGLNNSISIVVKLSDAVINAIDNAPTHTYFHHYRTVNAFIDHVLLRIGLLLEQNGYRYVPVAASQSINGTKGLLSHKMQAVKAGLGTIGKNALFLSEKFGPRVRLGTIITDCDLSKGFNQKVYKDACLGCNLCVSECPAMALSGRKFSFDSPDVPIIDSLACSKFMKEKFQHIGRGVVCGICMKVCPMGKR
ncbi:MAG: epoxyqueuosine reductase [Ruminococcaceae bacterium]|nr:epoxyqueuosine reductase [Oscillospiraceae bacterium]